MHRDAYRFCLVYFVSLGIFVRSRASSLMLSFSPLERLIGTFDRNFERRATILISRARIARIA